MARAISRSMSARIDFSVTGVFMALSRRHSATPAPRRAFTVGRARATYTVTPRPALSGKTLGGDS